MLRDKKGHMAPVVELIRYLFNDGHELSESQKKKCIEKFQSFKALGSSVISKNQLKKVLNDLGKSVSEEELFEMVEQADPNGYGYVSYQAFQKLVEAYKSRKQSESVQNIELTFQDILKAQKRQKKTQYLTRISWQYLQKYLLEHFELEINIKSMKGPNSTDSIGRQEFKVLFS